MARLDFPQGTERMEMFRRAGLRKQPGRKHNHQARGRARERQRQADQQRIILSKSRWEQFQRLVAAYWRGEIDSFPEKPK